jgi:hypothetical protein
MQANMLLIREAKKNIFVRGKNVGNEEKKHE